jgi:phenylpropionate dioxygenase-like ring-hydroxylating dioxygenase large terminal subunit
MSFTTDFDFNGVPFCLGHVDYYEANKPYKITYKNEDWELWKTSKNHSSIISHMCPHRHAPLSDGEICSVRNIVICPYHRWEFDGDGNHISIEESHGRYNSSEMISQFPQKSIEKNRKMRYLPFFLNNNWIWLSTIHNSNQIPVTLLHKISSCDHILRDQFTFEISYPLLYLLENLCDVDHFAGSHKKTFSTAGAQINSLHASETHLSYDFTTQIIKYGLIEKILNPTRFLFADFQRQRFDINVPNFAIFDAIISQQLSVFATLNWYPKNDTEYVVQAGCFEPKKIPFALSLFRPIITKLRQTAVMEDKTLLDSLYHENPNYGIRSKNDEPIYLLREMLTTYFSTKTVKAK